MDKVLYKINDAAQLLSIGRTTLYGLINAGEIRVVRIGGSVRVPLSELDRYAEQCLQAAKR